MRVRDPLLLVGQFGRVIAHKMLWLLSVAVFKLWIVSVISVVVDGEWLAFVASWLYN